MEIGLDRRTEGNVTFGFSRGSDNNNQVGELVVKEAAALGIGERKAGGITSCLRGLLAAIQSQEEGTKAPGNGPGAIGSDSTTPL